MKLVQPHCKKNLSSWLYYQTCQWSNKETMCTYNFEDQCWRGLHVSVTIGVEVSSFPISPCFVVPIEYYQPVSSLHSCIIQKHMSCHKTEKKLKRRKLENAFTKEKAKLDNQLLNLCKYRVFNLKWQRYKLLSTLLSPMTN